MKDLRESILDDEFDKFDAAGADALAYNFNRLFGVGAASFKAQHFKKEGSYYTLDGGSDRIVLYLAVIGDLVLDPRNITKLDYVDSSIFDNLKLKNFNITLRNVSETTKLPKFLHNMDNCTLTLGNTSASFNTSNLDKIIDDVAKAVRNSKGCAVVYNSPTFIDVNLGRDYGKNTEVLVPYHYDISKLSGMTSKLLLLNIETYFKDKMWGSDSLANYNYKPDTSDSEYFDNIKAALDHIIKKNNVRSVAEISHSVQLRCYFVVDAKQPYGYDCQYIKSWMKRYPKIM